MFYAHVWPPKAGGDPEGAGDAVPPNNTREGVVPGTVGSHTLDVFFKQTPRPN